MASRLVGLSLILSSLATVTVLPATAATSETPSVWDRVQKVDDPELGELIGAAMQNHEGVSTAGALEVIRKVTLGYAQVKLLDQQIAQVTQKIESAAGPADMRYELLLAKTELEAKLMGELTSLREVMRVIPKYPFDKQPVEVLNTWLRLNPVDEDRVYVLDTAKPIIEYWASSIFEPVGLMSQSDVIDLLRERLRDPNNLPIRIEILWTNDAAKDLRAKVVAVVKETHSEMEADVRLGRSSFIGSGESPFFLRRGKILAFYPAPVRRQSGARGERLVTGPIDPSELDEHVLWRIVYQWNLPLTFRIEYDAASFDLAQRIAEEVRATAERLGVTDLVGVKLLLVEPLPEAAFVGRWRAVGNGEVQELELMAGGQSELTTTRQPDGSRGSKVMSAVWYLTTKGIILDPQRLYTGKLRYVYRGHIDEEGHLVLDRGLIEPQGNFGYSGGLPITLERVN